MFWLRKFLLFSYLKISMFLAAGYRYPRGLTLALSQTETSHLRVNTVGEKYNVDEDYFFGESLRSEMVYAEECKSVKKLYCNYKCKNKEVRCLNGRCYCIYDPKLNFNEAKFLIPATAPTINKKDKTDDDLVLQPQLRHHIAHFCPNIDEARKCIRKCMKEGKPAFCGKDHICYCGHRYSKNQKKDKLDPTKINAGFFKLYEKYLGPDTTIMEKNTPSRMGEPIQIILYANKHKALLK